MMEQADPLNVPRDGCSKFSVAVYNAAVREAVKQNRTHHVYDDKWAERRHLEVVADTPEEARKRVVEQHPASEGFVVEDVEKLPFSV